MERLIRMRKETPEIGWGDFEILDTGAKEVLAILYRWRLNAVPVVHNLAAAPRRVRLELRERLISALSEDHSQPGEDGVHRFELEGYGYSWFRVGDNEQIARRSDV